jgi:hypothetical protein
VAPFNIATYRKQFAIAYRDVQRLYTLRYVRNNIVAMLESRPVNHNDSLVNNWLLTCYAETVAVGIRRQAEGNEGAPKATVGSLLLRIENQAGAFTPKALGYDYEPDPGRGHMWLNYAGTLKSSLDPERVTNVRQLVKDSASVAKHWVDKRIAHMDIKTVDSEVNATLGDLERALAGLLEGTMFLFSLLHPGNVLPHITPVVQYNWTQIFEEPWLRKGTGLPFDPTE